jgi:hypothetical protein
MSMSFKPGKSFTVALILGLATIVFAEPPGWWSYPRRHDEEHLYFKAKGESAESEQAARRDALAGIQWLLKEYIEASGPVGTGTKMHGVDVYTETSERQLGGKWIVYMLGRFPMAEYEKIRGRFESAEALRENWALAQSELARDEFSKAEARLKSIIYSYDQTLIPGFALESVKLALAGLYRKLDPPAVLEARKWIRDVQHTTPEPGWRRQAEDMERDLPAISLRDAFGPRKVGLFCVIRDARPVRASMEFMTEAAARLARDGVEAVRLDPEDVLGAAALFEGGGTGPLVSAARAAGAKAVLAILVAIDPAKTGRKIEVFDGVQMDALDATTYYYVIRVADGQILCSDKTLNVSSSGVSKLLSPVFAHRNHL